MPYRRTCQQLLGLPEVKSRPAHQARSALLVDQTFAFFLLGLLHLNTKYNHSASMLFGLLPLAATSAGVWNPAWRQELLQSDDKVAVATPIGEGRLVFNLHVRQAQLPCFAPELRSVRTQSEEEVGKRTKRARKESGRRRNKDAARAAAITVIDNLPQGRRLQLEHTFIQVSP